jgi:hypothetical protein
MLLGKIHSERRCYLDCEVLKFELLLQRSFGDSMKGGSQDPHTKSTNSHVQQGSYRV